jgi:tetratricopeptide (TPR) repeat protein
MSEHLRIAGPRHEALKTLDALLADDRRCRDIAICELANLRGLPRIEALIVAARRLGNQDPQTMLRLARLARFAVEHLSARKFGGEVVADLRALAWAELGNAHRICSEMESAGRAMNRAIFWCRRGSRSDLLLARVACLLASFLGYQRRFPDGCDLLRLVCRLHARAGRHHLLGRALLSQANLISWDGNPRKALQMMRRGFDLLEPDRDRKLELHTLWNMVTTHVDLGHYRKARRLLWQSRASFAEVIEPHRLRWLEGQIHSGLSDDDRAEVAFRQARQAFAERGQIYPAAIVGLDLAALWARQGRVEEVHALAEELFVAFRALRVAREAIASLLILMRACAVRRGAWS